MKAISKESLKELISLIQFIEKVATKLSYKENQKDIFTEIINEFKSLPKYSISILLISKDKRFLNIFGTTENEKKIQHLERLTSTPIKEYTIPLKKSESYRKVIYEQETIIIPTKKILLEIFPKNNASIIIDILGYDDSKQKSIITPLKRYNKVVGAITFGSDAFENHLQSTVQHFANHIKNTLQHAHEYQKRQKQKKILSTYKLAIENAQVMVIAVDKKGKYILANQPYLTYHQLNKKQVIGKHIKKIMGKENYKKIKPYLLTCLDGKTVKFEMNKSLPKQGKRKLKINYYPLKTTKGDIVGVAGIINDISEKEKITKTIHKQRKDLNTFFDSVPSAIFIKDSNALISKVNTKLCSLTNIPKNQWLGKTVHELFPKEFADIYHKDDMHILNTGEAKYNVIEPVPVSNGKIWMKSDKMPLKNEIGSIKGIIGFGKNITDQKLFQEKFLESEQKYHSLIQTAPVGIGLTDEEGIIIEMNPAMEQLTGFTKNEFIFNEQYLPNDHKNYLKSILKEEKSIRNYEIKLKRRDGKIYDTLLDVEQISINGSKMFLTIQRDISHLKKTEDKLKKTQKELMNSLKQRELLLEEIHHRVKNNLQIIMSLIDLQQNEKKIHEDNVFFDELKNRIYIMALLHEQLYKSTDFKHIFLGEYIKSITENLQYSVINIGKKISIKVISKKEPISFKKAIYCGLIVNELISNAIKHAFKDTQKGKITINVDSSTHYHCISIKDNGIGFPKSTHFKQSTSLGLRLVHMLVEQLHGNISLINQNGTCVRVCFPKKSVEE